MLETARNATNASRTRILVASDSVQAVHRIREFLSAEQGFSVETRIVDHKNPDPMLGIETTPDILLLRVGENSLDALEALARHSPEIRPPLVVIGDVTSAGCMRAAMQAGARDSLSEPVSMDELMATIMRLTAEQASTTPANDCMLTAFVNSKGGSGATSLACNIAHMFAEISEFKTALVGLDMQFASLPRYLDLKPKRGLLEALDVAADLDASAIEAYLTRHQSGLALLANLGDGAILDQALMESQFEIVLDLLIQSFERCVFDVPRRMEPFTTRVLESADQIVLVMQQTIPSFHDAVRMHDLLTRLLGVTPDRITIVVNRYRRAASVELSDIQQRFAGQNVFCIPNDFKAVTDSTDLGVPIYHYARRSPVTKALMQLESELAGRATKIEKGLLPRLLRTG